MSEFNNYFPGQYIENTDLNFDNTAHRDELAQRFNIIVNVPGVAQGYQNSLGVIPGSLPNTITILSGIAFDYNGKAIEITEDDTNRINIPFDNVVGITYYIKGKYKQLLEDPQYDPETGLGPDPQNPEIPYFTKIKDYYEISISTEAPELLEVEIGRVIGNGSGNLIESKLIDTISRKKATIQGDLLTNIDHTTLLNIGTLTHIQLEERLNQLFADTGLVPTSDGSPSLSQPLSELIGNIFDHDHSGDGEGARINHNSLINVHPDQHHKKIHRHSLEPGTGDSESDDGLVEKINLSDTGTEPIEVRGKLSGSYIKDETLTDVHISSSANIEQTKIDNSENYEDNFAGVPANLEQDLNELRTIVKKIVWGPDPSKRYTDLISSNLSDIAAATTDKFDVPNGHKHTGVDGDGPKLNSNSIESKSLMKDNIANGIIDDDLVAANAGIQESKLNLEDSYEFRNYTISGAGLASFSGGALNLLKPLIINNVDCASKVEAITTVPLVLNPGDTIFVEWPQNHDNNVPLQVQSSAGSTHAVTASTIVLGYVDEDDNTLYVKWGHNPFHRHTGAPGDGQPIDINQSTTGDLNTSRLSGTIQIAQLPSNIPANLIADGSVGNNEFETLDGITSNIQDQLDGKVAKAGDTMSGNLTFYPKGKGIVWQNRTSDSLKSSVQLNKPTGASNTDAILQLSLGTQDGSGANTNPELQIGQIISNNFNPTITMHGDSGDIEAGGDYAGGGNVSGLSLEATSGQIKGKNHLIMTDSDLVSGSPRLILNPDNDYSAGVKVNGLLEVDQLKISDQLIQKDTILGGVSFSSTVTANDFFIRNINESMGSLIAQLSDRGFRKEILTITPSNNVVLTDTPAMNSVSVTVSNGSSTRSLNEGPSNTLDDYVVSGKTITFNNLSTKPGPSDRIYVQYVVDTTSTLFVSMVDPDSGTAAGGDVVFIFGSGLSNATGVTFGSNPGTGLVINSNGKLTVTTPAGTGTVDVTVTTPTASFTLNNGFTYV